MPIATVSGSVNINVDGVGLYTLTPQMQSFDATDNYIEIIVYNSSGLENMITRQFIQPVTFDLSLFD